MRLEFQSNTPWISLVIAHSKLHLTRLSTHAIKSSRAKKPEPRTTHAAQNKSSPLLMLPFELRDMILGYLPLRALASLKMSCKDLYPSGTTVLIMYRVRKCSDSRFELLSMQEMDRPSNKKVRLLCSQCKQYHPRSFFVKDQQLLEDKTIRLRKGSTTFVETQPDIVRSCTLP